MCSNSSEIQAYNHTHGKLMYLSIHQLQPVQMVYKVLRERKKYKVFHNLWIHQFSSMIFKEYSTMSIDIY